MYISSGTNNTPGPLSQYLIIHQKSKTLHLPVKFLASNEGVEENVIFNLIQMKIEVIKTSVLHAKNISIQSFAKTGNHRPTLKTAETSS